MSWFSGLIALVGVIKEIISACRYLFQLFKEQKEYAARKAMAKEFKEAIKESVQSMDNTRLINLLNPDSAPFARVRKEEDPKV